MTTLTSISVYQSNFLSMSSDIFLVKVRTAVEFFDYRPRKDLISFECMRGKFRSCANDSKRVPVSAHFVSVIRSLPVRLSTFSKLAEQLWINILDFN